MIYSPKVVKIVIIIVIYATFYVFYVQIAPIYPIIASERVFYVQNAHKTPIYGDWGGKMNIKPPLLPNILLFYKGKQP